jgi:pimeloyl-ACP methyl ester carboxylesterase
VPQIPAPAYVLIHGGGTTGGFWDRLLPLLSLRALAVDLPGRAGKPFDPMTFTVAEGVAAILDDVDAAGLGDVILVAHSSGGLFVPGVAAALGARVRHIVLAAASVPPEGGLGIEAMKPSHRDRVIMGMDAARRDGWVLQTPGPPEDPESSRASYGGDPLDDDALAFMLDPARCIRDSMNFYFQPVSWASVATVPVTYVKGRRDRPVSPDLQDEMLGRLPNPVEVVELDTGHIPAVTHPEQFAAILERIAAQEASPR